jgi:hypothetical protein
MTNHIEPTADEIERVKEAIAAEAVSMSGAPAEIIHEAVARAAILAMDRGEPVLWQWRFRAIGKTIGEWTEWAEGRATPAFIGPPDYEVQVRPLYASPPARETVPIGYVNHLSEPSLISPTETPELEMPVYASPPAPAVVVSEEPEYVFQSVVEVRENAKKKLGTLREAMRLRRERSGLRVVMEDVADRVCASPEMKTLRKALAAAPEPAPAATGSAPFAIRSDWRGEWVNFTMPVGCDMILVCADTVQHKPVRVLLPHQLTVADARRLLDEHGAESLHVMPYRNVDKIKIPRATLTPEPNHDDSK